MNKVALIAWKEFADRLRSGWVIACAMVWLGAIGLTSLFGLVQIGRIGVQGYERTVVSLLNLVQYLVPLLGLLLGHDLIVSECEERTLALVLAGGVKRATVLLGKYIGGVLTLAVPLLLGFAIAGTAIGLSENTIGLVSFIRLAASGLVLGIVFLAVGLLISTLCRTRVQALVLALLAWCVAVFVFDLVAMGLLVSARSAQAARQVEIATDTTHINTADMHAAFEGGQDGASRALAEPSTYSATWLLINPVDLFRTLNLPRNLAPSVSPLVGLLSVVAWLGVCLGLAKWQLSRLDL